MANEVQMEEPLGFGRYENFTGAEMLKREDTIAYLVWVYNRTDIQMDSRIVAELVKLGLVSVSLERRNSKDCNTRFDRNPYRKRKAEQAFEIFTANRATIKDESSGDRVAKMIKRYPGFSIIRREIAIIDSLIDRD